MLDGDLVVGWSPIRAIARMPYTAFCLALLTFTVARNGVTFVQGKGMWLDASMTFPRKPGMIYESWGYLLPPHLLGITTLRGWGVYFACLTFAVAAVVVWTGARRSRFYVLAFAASAIPTIVLYNVGWYDVITVLGAAIVVASDGLAGVAAGALIMSSANPSEAAAAAVALVFVAAAGRWSVLGRKAVTAAAVTSIGFIGVEVWLRAIGSPDRGSVFAVNLHRSIAAFAEATPIAMYAWYGAAWLIVVALIAQGRGRTSRLLTTVGLIAIPGLVSMTTLDGTRVFAAVAALPFLAAASTLEADESMNATIALLALTPAIYFRGDTRSVYLSYSWLFSQHVLT
jgi:hypothetical protein